MDITVNQLFADQSDLNDVTESPPWIGPAISSSIKRAISDHYIHDKLSFDSGIICSANATNSNPHHDYNGHRTLFGNRGVPQSLTKFFSEDDEDLLALGIGEVSDCNEVQVVNELSCHNRELDWVVYVESFAERYYMEQNGVVERPQPISYEQEIERIARKRTETRTLSSASKNRAFGNKTNRHVQSWVRTQAEECVANDSPLYFGNSSVVLVKDSSYLNEEPFSPESSDSASKTSLSVHSAKNLTSWNRKYNSNQTPKSTKSNPNTPFSDFVRSSPSENQVRERKKGLRLTGLVASGKNARCQRVSMKSHLLARKRSMSCSSVSPSPSLLSTELEFPEVASDFGQLQLQPLDHKSPGAENEYIETQCMVSAIVDTCAEIRSVYSKHLKYTNATDKGFSELTSGGVAGKKKRVSNVGTDWRRKRDEMQSRELSHLVLSALCPELYKFVATGLSPKYTPWEVIRLGAVPVPGVTCIHELCLSVSVMTELESAEEKFNSFVFGLLNQKIMETWLLLLLKNSSLISGCYDNHKPQSSSSSSSRVSSRGQGHKQGQGLGSSGHWMISSAGLPTLLSNKVLFTQLLLAVQPLAFICFYTDLRFEINYLKHNFNFAPPNNLDLTPVSNNQVFTSQPTRDATKDMSSRVMSTYWASPPGGLRPGQRSNSFCNEKCTRTRLVAENISGDLPKVGGNYRCWDLLEASLGSLIRRAGCENRNLDKEDESDDPVTFV